jgi:multiple sugar transport system substrate-binding protein
MKKLFSLVCVTLLLGGAIFANGSAESTSPSGAQKSSGPVTIKYAFWGNPDAIGVEKDIIDAFEQQNPDIKVEPIVAGYNDYHSKLMTMIAGGMAPDVMRIDSYYFNDFTALGAVENLDSYVQKTGFDTTVYPPFSIKEATIGGHLYALPWGAVPSAYMLLNLDVFEKAGIPLPTYDWTIDEFENLVKKFDGAKSGCYGYAHALNMTASILPFVWADGGNLLSDDRQTYTMDKPEAYKRVQDLADLYQQGYLPKDSISADADMLSRWFTQGNLAMMVGTAQQILTIQKVEGVRFEAYPMPGGKIKNTTTVKSNEICMSTTSKYKDATWKFMSFLRGNEGERLYVKARRTPPTLTNDPSLWSLYLDPNKYPKDIEKATKAINEKYSHLLPLRKGYSELDSSLVPVLESIIIGNTTAKDGLTGFAPKAVEIISRNNK